MRQRKLWKDKYQLTKRGGSSGGGRGGGSAAIDNAVAPKTATQAAEWAAKNITKQAIYDEQVDPVFVNLVNEHLQQRLKDWGDKMAPMLVEGKYDSIRITKGGDGTDGMLAAMIPDTSQFIFNARNASTKIWEEHRKYSQDYANKLGNKDKLPWGAEVHVPKSKVVQFVIDHELGHIVHYGIGKKQQNKFAQAVKQSYKSGWRPVSAYSKTSKSEEFAEIFAIHAGGKRNLLTPEINQFLDNL